MFEDKVSSKEVFHCYGVPVRLEPGFNAIGRKILRPWQGSYVDVAVDKRLMLLSAPSGSGKSTAIGASSAIGLRNSNNLELQVIAVPYKIIGKSISGGTEQGVSVRHGNLDLDFVVGHDMTAAHAPSSGKVDALVAFLTAERLTSEDSASRVLLCCHMTLVLALEKIQQDDELRKAALRNLHVTIDECHHVNGVYTPEELNDMDPKEREVVLDCQRRLGNVVSELVEAGEDVRVTLASATMFRGDSSTLLSPATEQQFTSFTLTMGEYLPTTGIQDYLFEFVMWKNESDMVDRLVANIAAEKDEYHIVNNPGRTQGYRTDDDDLILKDIFKRLCALFPDSGAPADYDTGLGNKRVLDLVTVKGRDHRKALFEAEPQKPRDGTPQFQVVVAVRLVKEGTDMPCASRLHSLSLDGSPVNAGQADGRLKRRWDGKKLVINRQYLKDFDEPFSGMTQRELLEARVRSMLLLQVKKDELCPIMLPRPVQSQDAGDADEPATLTDYFGQETLAKILYRMMMEWESLPSEGKTEDAAYEIIEGILDTFVGESEDRKYLFKALKGRFISMVRPYTKLQFGFGFDHTVFDKHSFKALVEGKSGVFSRVDVGVLKTVDSILLKQFPEWCDEFEKSDFLKKYPKKGSLTYPSAYRHRSAYQAYLKDIPSSWNETYTKEIYRHGGKFLKFFNKGVNPKVDGECERLATLYRIEEFVRVSGHLPRGGAGRSVRTWYHWIQDMKAAKASGDWYSSLDEQCRNSPLLPGDLFDE